MVLTGCHLHRSGKALPDVNKHCSLCVCALSTSTESLLHGTPRRLLNCQICCEWDGPSAAAGLPRVHGNDDEKT